ncbi:T9SS type A sorting domain-containing protein [Pedobacter sp. SYSU D00535]|uniref:T9SS type A sorting domain-containing protein n=1 Tax=Pedobacter sp. SYSU D00535 TaxID=2810308 RepID=UPI001A97C08E|nr:T9SS type A sorting domain-containing protein [Pedobacter sp. SYSU D00535]
MKQLLFNLLIFSLISALGLPEVKGQDKKRLDRTIIIKDGDTIVNGKSLTQLDKAERSRVQKEFKDFDKKLRQEMVVKPKQDKEDVLIQRFKDIPEIRLNLDGDTARTRFFKFKAPQDVLTLHADTVLLMDGEKFVKRFKDLDSLSKRIALLPRGDISVRIPNAFREHTGFSDRPIIRPFRERENSQSFDYSNTDKNGYTTRMHITLSDVSASEMKEITGSEQNVNSLAVEDFVIYPNFSSGSMSVSFALPEKKAAVVKITDSEKKQLLSEKIAGSVATFSGKVNMSKNGIYYISINQSGKWFVKRVVKE